MIIVGCGIIESLLHYLIIANGIHSKTDWELVSIAPGNPKMLDGEVRKIDSHIYRKLSSPKNELMNFDAMIKKAESKKVLGSNPEIYIKLRRLRPLRNKVHLQKIKNQVDTDWNSFNWDDACCMAKIIKEVFTSSIFKTSADERGYFEYLDRYNAG